MDEDDGYERCMMLADLTDNQIVWLASALSSRWSNDEYAALIADAKRNFPG